MARIFLWTGHPRAGSFCHALADAYAEGAAAAGADIRRQDVCDMVFDPDLTHGYEKRKTLEPDLEAWRENILWANHLAWIYPMWWGGMPAKMKGVVDRAFLPGFAMNYHETGPFWDRLLGGRSADVILTADTPAWWDALFYGRPAKNQVRRLVLEFAGVKPVRVRQFASVKAQTSKGLKRWLDEARKQGARAA
jgi:putative NADPH-quinone reductase